MKKINWILIGILLLSLVPMLTGCDIVENTGVVPTSGLTRVKPEGNLAGAVEVPWNLSGDVMPVPPYGSIDIPGSDTASKLIVNQPNGSVKVTLTGVMSGLVPNTEYTVYLANAYVPDKWYPGLFTSTVQPFTFITDEYGSGSWHINLRDSDFVNGAGTYTLSVWIVAKVVNKTILISDNFEVVVD
ncbi:MAG: hypothetical protein JW870_20730 [Candidatus Delongbacteria bacterium]|nr:hypothetical protein [Candidatus Delongbacteria bacterium]